MRFKETASMIHCDRFKRLITNLLLIATFFLPTKVEAQRTAASQSLVIAGGTLIDGTGNPPLENVVIVIEGERIKSVGKRGEVAIPKGSRVINVKGKTILPGLIDGHCHLLDFMGELYLHLGITTCPDITQNDDEWTLAQRDGTNLGKIRGPRIWSTGARLVGPPPTWALRAESGYLIKNPDDAPDAVRNKRCENHEGRMTGKINTADLPFYYEPENFDKIIKAMAEKHVSWSPTIASWFRPLSPSAERFKERELSILNNPKARYLPAVLREQALGQYDRYSKFSAERLNQSREGYKKLTDFIVRFVQAGGIIRAGSDPNNGLPALGVHQEMVMFVEAGLTPMQAIQAATINVAKTFRKDKDFGTVEPGKVADVIAVDGDPLKDIWVVQNVKIVVLNGKIVDNDRHPNFKNPTPNIRP